ncbi:uncharacterized protein LOC111367754 [Olea europaea var. sylvestris]|uniref:uncharacterized protein LOC111367754 n=1 Tax=Olea europaea var. sylvestris TaxID=158386 RepID=UPI000C1D6979|nr:uncharacterized protein LOC111367754 [Olea europaea var. sylvestris]
MMKMGTNHVEIQQQELKIEGVSFIKPQGLGCKEKCFCSHKQLEIPKSPNNAMEFLCRSWSHSASDFLNIFSSRKILEPGDINRIEEHEEHEYDNMTNIPGKYRATIKEDNIRTWLKGKSLKSFLRSRKEKKKEETRLRTSQLHAALSLTQLAVAIAEISRGKQDFTQVDKGTSGANGRGMGEVVASAAALVSTAFAEAAESLGAQKAQVQAAVNSGMAIQTPIDMIAATATAATCLRGAAILRSRTMSNSLASTQEMIRMDAQICIIMPSGRKECRRVNVYMKQKHLTVIFRKKYFRGALASSKEYKVVSILETGEHQEYSFLSLKTNNGVIKLLFEDKMQARIWMSTIFNLFEIHSPYWLERNKDYHLHSSNTIV